MGVPTFIVATGCCDTAMVSGMLREHPDVLSLSEFFAQVAELITPAAATEAFSPDAMDGRRFWSIIAAFRPYFCFARRHGVPIPELLYSCDNPNSRFSPLTGVPAILNAALPHLTDDPDALFDALQAEVKMWPRAPIGEHYRHLFGWLATRFDKRTWIERSNGSLNMTQSFLAIFPDARIIHIARDGRDAALAMREHIGFRLSVTLISLEQFLGVNPLGSSDRSHIGRVPAELQRFLPEPFDANAFRSFQIPLPVCGRSWAQQIEGGLKILGTVPVDRLLTLRYEDFFVDPKGQLDRFAAFLGEEFVDEEWSARCAATVRPPRSTWRDLPKEEGRALTEACRPGFEQLAAAGVQYEF